MKDNQGVGGRGREREKEREREKQTERKTDREKKRKTEKNGQTDTRILKRTNTPYKIIKTGFYQNKEVY